MRREDTLPMEFRACAWSFILNGYSPKFIDKFHLKLPQFVDMVMESNDPEKLANLMRYSHIIDDADEYSVPSCAARVRCPAQIIGATEDRIAGVHMVRLLAEQIPGSEFEEMDTGHLAPFEDPVLWRKLVLRYLQE